MLVFYTFAGCASRQRERVRKKSRTKSGKVTMYTSPSTPIVSQKFDTINATRSKNAANVKGIHFLDKRNAFSDSVGILDAINDPTNSNMKIPKYGDGLHLRSSASATIAGVSTIQHPPGAGTPVKKCRQYGAVSRSSIVLNLASRKQSHIA